MSDTNTLNAGQVADKLSKILMQYTSSNLPIKTSDGKTITNITIKDKIITIETSEQQL